jgi:hypothetical protein
MLNDFGLAVPVGSVAPFAGNLLFAPDEILEQLTKNEVKVIAQPRHDLETLVKLIFRLLCEPMYKEATLPSASTPAQLLESWKKAEAARPLLLSLIESARACDYEAIPKLLRTSGLAV